MASANKDSLLGSAILLGLLLAYFCHNLFVFDNLISYIMFFSLLAYLATIYTETDPKSDDLLLGGRTYGPTTILIVVTLVVAGGLTCFYVVNLKPFWASQTLIQALSTSDPSAQLTDYQQIFSADTFGSREALEQYLSAGTALLDPKISNQNRSAYSNLAIEQIKTQTALAGNDARLYMVVGGFLTNVGRLDDALVYLNQAQLATPKKPSVYFQLASLYLIKKDNAKALEAVETARRLAPDYPEANVMSALVFIYVGQPDQAAKILQPLATNTSVILDDRLVTALSANHDSELLTWLYEQRVPLYQAAISSNPDDPKTYTALIDAETKLGQSVAAAKVKSDWQTYLEKKLKDHPELRVNYLALADYYQRQGDQAQAIAIINQAVTYLSQLIKTQPAVTTNYLELAKLFVQVNRADLARQVIEQGIKTNPNLRRDGLTFLATLPAGAN
jgi:tetratricopeptide (TPR) repeat protein